MTNIMSSDEEDFAGFDDGALEHPTPEVLKSSKGNDVLVYSGYIFYQNRKPVSKHHVVDDISLKWQFTFQFVIVD